MKKSHLFRYCNETSCFITIWLLNTKMSLSDKFNLHILREPGTWISQWQNYISSWSKVFYENIATDGKGLAAGKVTARKECFFFKYYNIHNGIPFEVTSGQHTIFSQKLRKWENFGSGRESPLDPPVFFQHTRRIYLVFSTHLGLEVSSSHWLRLLLYIRGWAVSWG